MFPWLLLAWQVLVWAHLSWLVEQPFWLALFCSLYQLELPWPIEQVSLIQRAYPTPHCKFSLLLQQPLTRLPPSVATLILQQLQQQLPRMGQLELALQPQPLEQAEALLLLLVVQHAGQIRPGC